MRPIGFSTGALAKGNFRRGLELQRRYGAAAIELSALRDRELEPLVDGLHELDLSEFDYVSVHAPSRLDQLSESRAFELLSSFPTDWPLIVHPGILRTPDLWRRLGGRLCIENMDNRKVLGRDADELRGLFSTYPEASFCLDVGHARQIDPTMAVALVMLFEFRKRLRQVHVSDVGPAGEHLPLRQLASWAFASVAHQIPEDCPLIIESVIEPEEIARELEAVETAFGPRKRPGQTPISASSGRLPERVDPAVQTTTTA